jgi:hypothetical protein
MKLNELNIGDAYLSDQPGRGVQATVVLGFSPGRKMVCISEFGRNDLVRWISGEDLVPDQHPVFLLSNMVNFTCQQPT